MRDRTGLHRALDAVMDAAGGLKEEVRREEAIRRLGPIAQHRFTGYHPGDASGPCKKCGLRMFAPEHHTRTKDAFQVTAVGMKKVAEAKRRDFLLMADNSEKEAENLRREGSVERAKKFLAQEAKWRAAAARSDEAIYREHKDSQTY